MTMAYLSGILLIAMASTALSFQIIAPVSRSRSFCPASTFQRQGCTPLFAGFGKADGKGKKKALSDTIKPKAQWDRYLALKKEEGFTVGVRVMSGDGHEDEPWLECGKVKSKAGKDDIERATALQRALIAEHAKKLYPLQILPKQMVEWGIVDGDGSEYRVVDKFLANEVPSGYEKTIGFEGVPDPESGFYCHYKDGRLVKNSEEEPKSYTTGKK